MNYSSYQVPARKPKLKITKELGASVRDLSWSSDHFLSRTPDSAGLSYTFISLQILFFLASILRDPYLSPWTHPPLPASPKQAAHFPLWSIRSKSLFFSYSSTFPKKIPISTQNMLYKAFILHMYFNPARHSGYLRYRLHVIKNSQLFQTDRLWAFIRLIRYAGSYFRASEGRGSWLQFLRTVGTFLVDGKDWTTVKPSILDGTYYQRRNCKELSILFIIWPAYHKSLWLYVTWMYSINAKQQIKEIIILKTTIPCF